MSNTREKRQISTDLHRLDRSVLLQEAGAPIFIRWTVGISLGIVLVFIVWACLIEVDEVAKAKGEMISSLPVHSVQHLYGGEVLDVFVQEGQMVERGTVLLRLNVEEIKSQLAETRIQWQLARARRIGLEHFLDGKENLSPEEAQREVDRFQEIQLHQKLKSLASTREVIAQQIVQLNNELEEDRLKWASAKAMQKIVLEEQARHAESGMVGVKLLEQQKMSLEEELKIREDLVDQGLNSEIQFLGLKRQHFQLKKDIHEKLTAYEDRRVILEKQVSQVASQVESLPLTISRKEANILELKGTIEQKESEILDSAMEDRDRAFETESIAQERLKRLEERVAHAEILAPVEGSVHGLRPLGRNSVLNPGERVCTLVPKGARLVAELRIENKDVGHLEVEQPVRIKMTSFDFSRYGSLPAKLSLISMNKSLDEKGQPYFLAQAEMGSHRPAPDKKEMSLRVGMSFEADIVTGKKTVMEYLLKPIYASTLGVLQER